MSEKAKESSQVEKARQKILERFQETDKKINPETIAAMTLFIKSQLARQHAERANIEKRQKSTLKASRRSVNPKHGSEGVGDIHNKKPKSTSETQPIEKRVHTIFNANT
ncbi:MAG: hypothetical protein WCF65_08635 [Parachlamydiaceae bacterium]